MHPLSIDLSIYKKFNFKKSPVGIKLLYGRPKDMKQLDGKYPICEMFKLAQEKDYPFYISKENESCVGRLVLGMEEYPAYVDAGELGEKFGIYKDANANRKIYDYIPMFNKGIINYVAYATLDKLTFDPDLLMIMGTPTQAEIVLRAMSWSTGQPFEAMATSPLGCSWLYVHPLKSNKVNYTITGLAFGSKAKHIFEEGQVIISIPFNWIPTITQNLKEMVWELPAYTEGRKAFEKREMRLMEELAEKYKDEISGGTTDIYQNE